MIARVIVLTVGVESSYGRDKFVSFNVDPECLNSPGKKWGSNT